jgi:hypothetical protein
MSFKIGIENNIEGRSLAWALEHPGCFAYGENGDAALVNMPRAISDYCMWIESRVQSKSWLTSADIELHLAESWEVYHIDEKFDLVESGYEVNAWFRHDWKPLSDEDVARALQLFSWSRDDLMDAVSGLPSGALDRSYAGERWSIAGILRHVAGAEWWYMDRLGLAFPRKQVPVEPFERLEVVRASLMEALPGLAGLKQVVGVDGEFWSPRKMLRRAVWHERDHTAHIYKLRGD